MLPKLPKLGTMVRGGVALTAEEVRALPTSTLVQLPALRLIHAALAELTPDLIGTIELDEEHIGAAEEELDRRIPAALRGMAEALLSKARERT